MNRFFFTMAENIPSIQIQLIYDKFCSISRDCDASARNETMCSFIIAELQLDNTVDVKSEVLKKLNNSFYNNYKTRYDKLPKNNRNQDTFILRYSDWLKTYLQFKTINSSDDNSTTGGKQKFVLRIYVICLKIPCLSFDIQILLVEYMFNWVTTIKQFSISEKSIIFLYFYTWAYQKKTFGCCCQNFRSAQVIHEFKA